MEYKDYYKILGVERNADEKTIKQAYRRLARQHHPDVKPGDKEAEARFKEINEAYEVLGDAEKRKKYDQLGSQWQQWERSGFDPRNFDWSQWTRQQAAGGPQGGEYYTSVNMEDLFGGGGRSGGFSDFFEALFGGLGGGRATQGTIRQGTTRRTGTAARQRLLDVEHPIEITLEEAYQGTERTLQVDGRRLQVKIPAGVRTGSRVRVSGEGANDPQEGRKGDLYLHITVAPHPQFERKDNHLYTEVSVDLYTAVLGGEVHVPTLTGRVALRIPPETQSGRSFRLAGLGMPSLDGSEKGNLYVKVRVTLPEKLSDEEKRLFQQLAKLRQKREQTAR